MLRTSVVIPCYKQDQYLAETLRSIADQSRPVREIIVVDDGSPEPLTPPQDWQGPELIWVRTENQGLGAARNEGLRRARGEFVAFVDADDFWEPRKIELQENRLDDAPQAVACYTQCVDAEGFFGFGPYPDKDLPADPLAVKLWYGQFFPPSSILVRRQVADRVGGFREGLRNGEDLDMWFRLLEQGEIVGVDQPLTWYRIHPGQITHDDVRKILGAKQARQGILDRFSERLLRGGVAANSLWDAYRDEILCVFYRRRFPAARRLLWDFWRDHPTDLRVAIYLLVAMLPAGLVAKLRGSI